MKPLCSPGEYCVLLMIGAAVFAIATIAIAAIEDGRKKRSREYDEHLADQLDQEF